MEDNKNLPSLTNDSLVNEITKGQNELRGLSLDEIERLACRIVKSGFTPLNAGAILTPEQYKVADLPKKMMHDMEVAKAVAIGKKAQELQIPMMAAFANLHAIKTQAGLQVTSGYHLINSLIRRAGCIVRFTRINAPITKWLSVGGYVFDEIPSTQTGVDADNKPVFSSPRIGIFPKDRFGNEIINYDKDGKINSIIGGDIAKFVFDRETTVEIERMIAQPDGTFKTEVQTNTYSWLDDQKFINAQYKGEAPKNRGTYEEIIFTKIPFTRAARWIADDVLLGIMETGELLDSQGTDYAINSQNGEVIMLGQDGNPI